MAEDTEYFIWIPNSEPRRYGAVFAAWGAALVGIACVCAIGNIPPRGIVDAYIGAELSRTDAGGASIAKGKRGRGALAVVDLKQTSRRFDDVRLRG